MTTVIDDPLKPKEALSKAQRQACNEWFVHTLYSRLNDKRSGVIIIIMQRLHEDDLVGHVLEQESWEVLRFPAIAEGSPGGKNHAGLPWAPRSQNMPVMSLRPSRATGASRCSFGACCEQAA